MIPRARGAARPLRVEGEAVLAIVVEVQLRPDPDKRFAWLAYVGTLHARLRCPVCLLVVTADDKTAAWCRKAVDAGPGLRFEPVVLGPAAVPVVDDPAVAKGLAEGQAKAILAVLDARGLRVSAEARARIQSCTEAEQLAAWVRKAATAASADEIF